MLASMPGDNLSRLRDLVSQSPNKAALLANAEFDSPVGSIEGYACNVTSLYGDNFALLGNAGEFLDPVFSSGVTIALKSASLGPKRRMNGMAKLMARAGRGLSFRLPTAKKTSSSDTEDSDSDDEDDDPAKKEPEMPFEPLEVWKSPHQGGEAKGLPPQT